MPPRCSSTAQQLSPSATRNQVPERGKQRRDSTADRRPPRPRSSALTPSGTHPRDAAEARSGRSTVRKGGRAAPRPAPGRSRPAPPRSSRGTCPEGAQGERSAGPAAQSPARSPGSPLGPPASFTQRNRSPRPGTAAPLGAGASQPSPQLRA